MIERTIEAHPSSVPRKLSDSPSVMAGWMFLIASVLLSAVAQIFLKAGAMEAHRSVAESAGAVEVFLEPMVMAGLMFYGLGTLLWLKCLTRLDLSLAYLVSALQYVFVFVAAKALFSESLSATRLTGLAVILVGIVIVSRKRRS